MLALEFGEAIGQFVERRESAVLGNGGGPPEDVLRRTDHDACLMPSLSDLHLAVEHHSGNGGQHGDAL